ncbi:glycoside hydrolase family 3 C-terminal domain-containing protein, partial [Candidatus Soleaferrea massiliensis]|uniref:glycoside hydrolase family 3 C-terminal domain-containing protein n=1 Tax=Candidatus Soleaferrea massiliensis TaxID=1470354 RepID=UPI00058E2254
MKRKKTSRILAIALSAILAANSFGFTAFAEDASTAGYPELETKVNEVLSQLTLRDRSYFANGVVNRNAPGQNPNVGSQTKAFPEAGLSYMSVCDGPTGVNQGGRAHTGFGSGMIIASTWNRDLTYKVGEVIGKECIAKDVQYFLGPACNINRDLINGRTFEYYSEDPYLSGQVVTPYVKGVQDQDVATTIKHYLANNQEKNRNFCSSNVSERALHEVYLPAFKEVTEEGDAWGVMTAANRMNGVFTSDNRYTMTNLLKDDYGMRGIIMTDWCNTRTDIIAAKAGLDLAMPESNGSLFAQARMEEYVRSGRLDVSYLNNLSQRLIRAGYLTKSMITTDEIDNTGYTAADRKPGEINTPENQAVARQVGEEGITLLKNQDKILPINKDEVKSIAVLGKYVDYNFYGNHGGSGVNFPPYQITNIQGLNNKLAGSDVTLNRAGYDEGNADKTIADAVEAAKKSEVAIVYAGLNSTSTNDPNVADTEDGDRGNLDFPEFQKNLINAVAQANPNTIVVLSGSMYEVRDWVDNVKGVVQTYYAGMEGGNAAADVLLGNVNPSGKLTNTWPKRYEDTQGYVPGHEGEDQRDVKYNDVWYKEGVYVGYKWNDKMGIEPEFPFGYGLSYTDFTYSNIRLSADEMGPEGTVTAMVDVTNSGDMPGKEVVQMYIHDPAAKVQRPLKELKGYEKISLDPGETKTVSFTIDKDDLCYWDVDFHSFMADAGEFQVWIGSNSEDLPMKASFNLTAGTAPDEDYQVIQAESGTDKLDTLTLSNDEVDAELTGSPKTQYLKLTNAGATAKWKVSVPQDGRYSIIVRYSNAGFNGPSANSYGPNKISALTVNGMPCGNYDFQNTRWENVWNFDSIDVELKAGENEIQITAGETAADLNIDKLIVQTLHDDYPEPAQCAPDSGDVTPPEPGEDGDVYQAENFRLESGVSAQSKYPNYTGDGYAAFEKAGSEASWDIISPTFAEGFRVAVTYANGNDTPSACDIYVNGIHYGSYYLPPTGSWGRWKTEQSPILTFRTGLNTIRIVSKDGSVSIDKLIVSGGMVDNETTPPVINATLPREGGTLTGVTGTAIAAFSEIIRESGGFANISMKDADGDAVAVSASIEGTKVLISPKSPLQYDHTYTVTIPKNAVTDEKNNQFAEDYSFSFKTPMAYIFEEDGAAIDFGGSWTADENDAYSGGRARVTSTANATANFWIDGPNAVIYGTKGPDMGIVEIKIDNGDIVRTVDLYSPEVQYQQPIVDTGSLTSGMHMITVRVTGDKNPQSYGTGFAFDYVSVVGSMAGQSLSKQGWDARSFAADDTAGGYGKPEGPAAAFDSNSSSRWVSCNMQSPGQWYMLDLGKEVNFNTLA